MTNKRQSHGLTLPRTAGTRDSVVSNILSSLATLDQTAQIQWVQETSRQVDYERDHQRRENRHHHGNGVTRHPKYQHQDIPEESDYAPTSGVGYKHRAAGDSTITVLPGGLMNEAAPSPSVPMGRPSKQGFFRRFMGFGPKVPIEEDLLITSLPPKRAAKNPLSGQVREIKEAHYPHDSPPPPPPPMTIEESRPNLIKKKSSNFFRRRPKSAGNGAPVPFSHQESPPPLPIPPSSYPSSNRNSILDPPITNIRHNIENHGLSLSNGTVSRDLPSRSRSQTSPKSPYRSSPLPGLDNAYPPTETVETAKIAGESPNLTSSTSFPVDREPLQKSPATDKAREIMGLRTVKSISPISNTNQHGSGAGHTDAPENENTDTNPPAEPTNLKKSVSDERLTSEEDRIKEYARDIFNCTESLITFNEASSWLMKTDDFNSRVRDAYMELFDFVGLDILAAVRRLCARLHLKGETQQLDRILEALGKQWYESNPENGLKDPDVAHAIAYSIFLLNTDLHIVDISSSQRMTRSQFVRNTTETILNQLPDHKRLSTAPARASTAPKGKLTSFPSASSPNLSHTATSPNLSRSGSLLRVGQATGMARNPSAQSLEHGAGRPSKDSTRTAERLSWSLFDEKVGPFGGMASLGSQSAWEAQLECFLKEVYVGIKSNPLQQAQTPLSGNSSLTITQSQKGGGLTRSASILSHASHVSESGSTKARTSVRALMNRDWLGRSKSQPRLPLHLGESNTSVRSDRSSMEDRARSPPNSAPSRHLRSSSHGRSPSVLSADSFSTYPNEQGSSIGFANSLSQAIIREENHPGHAMFIDEEIQEHALILSGPPWAKEGVLKSKRHIDANMKKARDRGWTESFAVIDKGQMRLFQFDSRRTKNVNHLGGGNWQQNANMIGSFLLRQTLASALPAPGYSRQRQHVWALTLSSGSIYFFETGTADLVKEWVSCANYWAARTSKEPLKAGVSNMEWGWGECLALGLSEDEETEDDNSPDQSRRSTFEVQPSPTTNGKKTFGAEGRELRGDTAMIHDWRPPQQSLMGSALKERDQLKALESYITRLEEEFAQHNHIRPLMLKSFSPRHPNISRALANWERKSQYLLREIVKYKTYVEILTRALTLREELVAKSKRENKSSSLPGSEIVPPEPWLDLSSSAPTSHGTAYTKDTRGEKDEMA